MSVDNLIGIPYSREDGPLSIEQLKDLDVKREKINCQGAVQQWYRDVHGFFLPHEDALSAESFQETSAIVVRDLSGEILSEDFIKLLSFGDLVHAERRSRNNPQENIWTFERAKELHVAIFAGSSSDHQLTTHLPRVEIDFQPDTYLFYHGTNGGTAFIPVEMFIKEYQLVQARRIPDLKGEYQAIYQS